MEEVILFIIRTLGWIFELSAHWRTWILTWCIVALILVIFNLSKIFFLNPEPIMFQLSMPAIILGGFTYLSHFIWKKYREIEENSSSIFQSEIKFKLAMFFLFAVFGALLGAIELEPLGSFVFGALAPLVLLILLALWYKIVLHQNISLTYLIFCAISFLAGFTSLFVFTDISKMMLKSLKNLAVFQA